MSPTVRLLGPTLIDQIAAGEVIERPANLVKELLENAIDAGAGAITVSVEDGGRSQVRVTDDGIGMSPEDAELCIQRHATSKIVSFEDLVQVRSLGFRGEALPSIAAVSKMTITTRPREDLAGTRVLVEGGDLREISPSGCPPGTTVEVQDLFYNVPARKKFLRARQTETSRIFEVCQRVALSRPELRLQVTSDGRTARQYLPARALAERAYQVFGEVGLQEIHAERDEVLLDALLARVEHARVGARQLYLFVNGRPINDRGLARAVAFAFGDQLPPGQYPRGLVSLRLAPEDVDVNAHPQKTEVRFRNTAQLMDRVTRMIAARLPAHPAGDAYWEARIGAHGPIEGRATSAPGSPPPSPSTLAESIDAFRPCYTNGLRLVAQVRDRVLICESNKELVVFDRARAETEVRYDALRQASEAGTLARSNLLFPDRLDLERSEQLSLERHEAILRSLGFDWSPLGERSYVLRAIPALLAEARPPALFKGAIASLGSSGEPLLGTTLRALAKSAATPNGKSLDERGVQAIVANVRLSDDRHRACILARVTLPSPAAGIADD